MAKPVGISQKFPRRWLLPRLDIHLPSEPLHLFPQPETFHHL